MTPPRPAANLFGEEATPAVAGYAHVALEQGIDVAPSGLTYAVPEALGDLAVGERVNVPLGRGNKPVPGYVVELTDACELKPGQVKFILERDRQRLSLPRDLIELARWIAGYYCTPIGMVFGAMLPAAVKRGTGTVTQTLVGLGDDQPGTEEGREAAASGAAQPAVSDASPAPKLTPLQRKIVETVQQRAEQGHPWTPIKELADLAGAKTTSPVKQLIDKGHLRTMHAEAVVSDLDLRAQQATETVAPLALNGGQQQALDHLAEHLDEGFGVHLLHGVTGSGKTEVYLRIIERVMADVGCGLGDGQSPDTSDPSAIRHPPSAIVLVPEIALTPQTVARFLQRFESVAVLHSGLTAAQRHSQWRRIREGRAQIVIGARSAVFAPVADLRLIIVDEEHEPGYKQDQLPRYHGRDVAIKRAQMHGIPVVLGSATPSLESYYNATKGIRDRGAEGPRDEGVGSHPPSAIRHRPSHYHLIRMPDRVPGMKLPEVELVDLQEERRQRRGIHLLSQRLEHELTRLFGSGEGETSQPADVTRHGSSQAILLLNRRGYANYIACPDHNCGWMMRCEHCDVTMVYHKDRKLPKGGLVRCHHCLAEQLLVRLCPMCSKQVTIFGLGTQRVEEELSRKFPHVRALRMDGDTMRTGRDYQQSLDRFRRGEVDVLLGTQMIAKGLDFPSVHLVGVISGDTSLHMPDFRAAERTFQLIAQVAGRAGRSDQPGRVIVQSFNVDDPAIQSAAQHDYEGFARRELAFRAEVGLPPVTRMARVVVRDEDHYACAERARTLADHLGQFNEQQGRQVRLRGPMPCPIARIAGYHRQQIEMIAAGAGQLQRLLTALRNTRLLSSDMHTAVDVDPVALL